MLSLPAIFAGRLRLCILGKCVFMSGSGASVDMLTDSSYYYLIERPRPVSER
ncbi:Uncharacterised protein [Niallia circulans]|nr:Uncharacterised protein [Niallia circulans]